MSSIDRIKQLEERVAQAKKNVRANMSIAEYSKESIRDIIAEVSTAQTHLSTLFGKSDTELKGSTVSLRNEISKLVKESTDADAARIKDIRKRIREISKISTEEGGAEGNFITEYGNAAEDGMRQARKHRLRGDNAEKTPYGAGLFTTILGSGVTNWLLGTSSGSSKKRHRSDLRLQMAEADLEAVAGDTPAEKEEIRREGEVRQKDIIQKENTVVDLLEEIRNNTKLLLGGAGGLGGSGGGGGGGGGVDSASSGGFLSNLLSFDNILLGSMLAGPVGKAGKLLAKTRAGAWIASALGMGKNAKLAGLFGGTGKNLGFGAIAANRAKQGRVAGVMAKLGMGARVSGASRLFGGLISFGVTEAIWQVGNAFLDSYNEDVVKAQGVLASGKTYVDASGVTRSMVGSTTDMLGNVTGGSVIFDPNASAGKSKNLQGKMQTETSIQTQARNKLKANEQEVKAKLQEAESWRKLGVSDKGGMFGDDGNWIDGQLMANQLLGEARGLIEHRAELVKSFGPRSKDEAVGLLKFSKGVYGDSQRILDAMMDTTRGGIFPEFTDRGAITDTKSVLSLLDPSKMNQQFWQDLTNTGASLHLDDVLPGGSGSGRSSQMRMMETMGWDDAGGTFKMIGGKMVYDNAGFTRNQQDLNSIKGRENRINKDNPSLSWQQKAERGLLPYDVKDGDNIIYPSKNLHPELFDANGNRKREVSMLPSMNRLPGTFALDRNAFGRFDSANANRGTNANQMAMVNAPSMNLQNTTNYIADPFDESSLGDGERIHQMNDVNYNLRYT